MSNTDAYVRSRIDKTTKKKAMNALKTMGLTATDAIRLLMEHIAREHCLPIDLEIPNAMTRVAIAEARAGGGRAVGSISELLEEMNAED